MKDKDIYNSARRYIATNAVIGSAASKMAELNREQAVKIAQMRQFYSHYKSEQELADKVGNFILSGLLNNAYDYLNDSLKAEFIHDCQNQKEFQTHLSDLIEERKSKYLPFYSKIGMEMPVNLKEMTAEEICSVMSVELLTREALQKYHKRKEDEEWADKLVENLGIAFRAILIIGLVILMIYLSAE